MKKSTNEENDFQLLELENEILTLYGYKKCWARITATSIATVLTAGLLLLIFHWRPLFRLKATHRRCSLSKAKKIHIKEIHQKCKSNYIRDVEDLCIIGNNAEIFTSDGNTPSKKNFVTMYFDDGTKRNVTSYRLFKHKKQSYVWDCEKNSFMLMIGIEKATLCSDFYNIQGYSIDEQKMIRLVYGNNDINVPIQSIFMLVVLEFFNPFYIFQLFTIAVWLSENYYYYCVAIVIMSVCGIATSVIQTRKNQINLKQTVESNATVQVCRNKAGNIIDTIQSTDLVPGDIIIIPANGCIMQVDAVLLEGSCIVNESMLTGESVPLTKTAISHAAKPYSIKDDSHHTLYCGTKVIQTRYYSNEYVRAVVLRTGFQTTKGQLVRSIMYPTPSFFKFDQDSYWFIVILTVIAAIGLVYTITIKSGQNTTVSDVIIKSLDILTIVIPPALPAAMTVGRLYAITRLRKCGIFCINPKVINVCGSVTCVCFDKTGTLTEDGLDMWGVVPVSFWSDRRKKTEAGSHFEDVELEQNSSSEIENMEPKPGHVGNYIDIEYEGTLLENTEAIFANPIKSPYNITNNDMFKVGLAVCHSLTILDGELTGDPLEIKMFESTNWILEEPTVDDTSKFELLAPTVVRPPESSPDSNYSFISHQWGIVANYQFSSSLQRSSVICKSLTMEHYIAFTKGSPEMIKALSLPETIPKDLKSILRSYTQQGYRVLAMACKPLRNVNYLSTQKLTREEVECELTFLGLIVLENRLKVETEPVIKELKEANIKVVMITGDNLDTAVSVASECGILQLGEKLIICDTAKSENKDAIPSLYFTSSIISVQGLNMSHTDPKNLPKIIKVPPFLSDSTSSNLYPLSTSQESIEAGIVPTENKYRLAMNGQTWHTIKEYYPQLVPRFATRGIIFARMSSDQKQQLVQELQSLGYYVAMCGDGANDCGALKAAHVGISVSGNESSVASPFTSKEANVTCVPCIIKEGRAALTTAFGMFKFIVSYSLAEFLSVAILYYYSSNLTDFQFLFIDVVLILSLASLFGKTGAYPNKLFKVPPGTSLLSFVPIMSLILQFLTILTFQLGSLFIIQSYPWYKPHKTDDPLDYLSYENYSVFAISMFQYIILTITFSRGYPYRKSIFSNYPFIACAIILTALCCYITIYPADWLRNLLELEMPIGIEFSGIIIGLAVVNLFVSLFFEKFIVEYLMQVKNILPERLQENPNTSFLHHSVEREIENERDWPPLSNRKKDSIVENVNEAIKVNNDQRKDNINHRS